MFWDVFPRCISDATHAASGKTSRNCSQWTVVTSVTGCVNLFNCSTHFFLKMLQGVFGLSSAEHAHLFTLVGAHNSRKTGVGRLAQQPEVAYQGACCHRWLAKRNNSGYTRCLQGSYKRAFKRSNAMLMGTVAESNLVPIPAWTIVTSAACPVITSQSSQPYCLHQAGS